MRSSEKHVYTQSMLNKIVHFEPGPNLEPFDYTLPTELIDH